MRALGFCVSIAHAEYMAEVFTDAGISARAVSGQTTRLERDQALADLRARTGERPLRCRPVQRGLNIPEVDTVLFLSTDRERHGVSATAWPRPAAHARQGRYWAVLELRLGYHRKEFNFGRKLRALTATPERALNGRVTEGFPFLPAGCQIVMDQTSQALVLDNIRSQIASRWDVKSPLSSGRTAIRTSAASSSRPDCELSDILRRGSQSWTQTESETSGSRLRQLGVG